MYDFKGVKEKLGNPGKGNGKVCENKSRHFDYY